MVIIGEQGPRGLDGIQGPPGPMGQMSTSNQNGTSGNFVVAGHIIGDGSMITGVTTAHVVGLDASLATKATNVSVDTKIAGLATTVSVDTKIAGLATTASVDTKITNLIGGADGAYDTLKEIETMLKNNESVAAALVTSVASKADNTATTALLNLKAPLINPSFTGLVDISGNIVVHGNIIGDGSLVTGIVSEHIVGLDTTIAGLATNTSVDTKIANLVGGAGGAYDTLKEIETMLKADPANDVAEILTRITANNVTINNNIDLKANKSNPVFSGSITIDGATLTGANVLALLILLAQNPAPIV